jgi:hypothetical protein
MEETKHRTTPPACGRSRRSFAATLDLVLYRIPGDQNPTDPPPPSPPRSAPGYRARLGVKDAQLPVPQGTIEASNRGASLKLKLVRKTGQIIPGRPRRVRGE